MTNGPPVVVTGATQAVFERTGPGGGGPRRGGRND